ncbi:MAG: DUF5518 domain-containing protein [Halanaeroarchaeum sp.]
MDDALRNALIGALVSVVLAFLPFSTVLGGGVAGYLQDGSRDDGLRVGAYAGAIASIPLTLGMLLVAVAVPFVIAVEVGLALVAGLVLFAIVVAIVYGVALSAAGGYLGALLAESDEP